MLFNSYEFLFLFLPIVAVVFFAIGTLGHHRIANSWLVAASLFFYGWWNPAYLGLIIGSIFFNYSIGVALGYQTAEAQKQSKLLLSFGIAINLLALSYFKYANFFIDNFNTLFGGAVEVAPIILPLAISFFTFQQIAFLVDAYQGQTREYNFLHYSLFVTFFPQLIAGPIVHHKEMLPQFAKEATYKVNYHHIAIGITIIIIGLFKKVVIADGVAIYSDPIFAAADRGAAISSLEAWGGALAYTVQLYFDFSGYIDMATGAAKIFGITLPINFNSPYKSLNIIEFWRRWHITLSRFLRDYLYIPLGGNRKGLGRRYANLMLTMLLGGLWHGAGWTFVFWGFLHGAYLVINHVWHAIKNILHLHSAKRSWWTSFLSWSITFIAISVAWVFFRAESFSGAIAIFAAMFGKGLTSLPDSLSGRIGGLEGLLISNGFTFNNRMIIELSNWVWGAPLIIGGLLIAVFMPNSNQLFEAQRAEQLIFWRPNLASAIIVSLMFAMSLVNLFKISPFLYFNF